MPRSARGRLAATHSTVAGALTGPDPHRIAGSSNQSARCTSSASKRIPVRGRRNPAAGVYEQQGGSDAEGALRISLGHRTVQGRQGEEYRGIITVRRQVRAPTSIHRSSPSLLPVPPRFVLVRSLCVLFFPRLGSDQHVFHLRILLVSPLRIRVFRVPDSSRFGP